ncbi:hypothetical protein Kpol_534p25 [Vanderwaltozyma polyspora DSM 70294]|uniref:Anaphase-promoting complex subunit 4 WD40 domain-containing protein n=1 Tax=Vanderwaltozyma polyspora (strain ATCC 22028 / DSM 70294 / BCRC 21397 / CBS 2163 / NBRC 10782 / NRRL Y-8283 / UCD 57-17) TaxID=436907 RepID=A7TJK3_VANPO|nr:uncharacterized protein Kpol_534p25 [Vanderwaltozyma polyspora DSM 70294]EDO17546.1 hypothetical protein Kpol_534p25 [Vanderwaltozyma polyspora DSM 70294]
MRPFDTGHEDLVHDVSYDFYGRYVATCSSDQHVKVFRLDKDSNEWILSDSWRAHDSSIVSVDWASPEYGRIIATASYDKSVKIWEEDPDQDECSGRRWTKLCTLNDSKGSLYSAKFAPSHLGLKLACIGNDGILRIYEALDPSDLRSWTLTTTAKVLNVPPASHLQSDFCISWCPSRFQTERIAVCVLDQAIIYQKNTQDSKFYIAGKLEGHNGLIRSVCWAPSIGRAYQLIATGCKDGKVRIYKVTEDLNNSGVSGTVSNSATTTNSNGSDISTRSISNDNTTDGASNQREDTPSSNNSLKRTNNSLLHMPLNIELLSAHDDHGGQEVWSVSWNLTGTILSSAGGDGKVRLWKATYSNEFKCMSVITAQQT